MTRNFTQLMLVALLGILVAGCAGNGPLRRGNRHFENLAYSKAIPKYEKALKKEPGNAEALTKLADCHRLLNDAEKAKYWYSKVVKLKDGRAEDAKYYGQALMNTGDYEGAADWFRNYLKEKPGDQVAKKMLWSCENYEQFMKDSSLYTVHNVTLNTPEADFGPSFYKNSVVYSSARERSEVMFLWNGRYFLDLYASPYGGRPDLSGPEKVRGRINTKYHEAITTYTPDGKTVYFTRNNFTKGKIGTDNDGTILLKTYSAELKEGRKPKWKKVKELKYNSDDYSVGHPALSPDGKKLYLVSDKPGGQGGTDLYVCEMGKTGWGEPQNLGPGVNTPGNEMFPWVSPSGVLYFASNGHEGLGGLDIFVSQPQGSDWSAPVNMGYPINSPRDDFSLIMDEKRGVGFFSSNRTGGEGDDDIYSFRKKQVIKGIVVEKGTGRVIDVARVELSDVRGIQGTQYSDEEGEFAIGGTPNKDYYVITSKEGFKDDRRRISTKGVPLDDEVVVKIELEPVDACNDAVVLEGNVVGPNGEVPPPGTKVRVSQEDVIVDVDPEGNFDVELQPERDYVIKVEPEDGSPGPQTDLTTRGVDVDTIPLKMNMEEAWEIGKVFYIIYYDFDKHNIRDKDARPELDRVVNFMKRNPLVKVELGSHTDCRGSNSYNNRLSKNRAIEAWEYITSHGIEKDRLTYQWYGEMQLTNQCADGKFCSEEDHQLNRRTEFKFMGFVNDPVKVEDSKKN